MRGFSRPRNSTELPIERIVAEFPELFPQQHWSGIPEGWYNLVRELCLATRNLNENRSEKIAVYQIKDKFGGLRFYTSSCPDELHDLISEAERRSYAICPQCGHEDTSVPEYHSIICKKCSYNNPSEINKAQSITPDAKPPVIGNTVAA
jgi:hypothetical protein